MKKLLPLAVVAGALACFVAAGSAQAAPASGGMLGKLSSVAPGTSTVQQAHYYYHRRWWHRRYYHYYRWHRWHRWHRW